MMNAKTILKSTEQILAYLFLYQFALQIRRHDLYYVFYLLFVVNF